MQDAFKVFGLLQLCDVSKPANLGKMRIPNSNISEFTSFFKNQQNIYSIITLCLQTLI